MSHANCTQMRTLVFSLACKSFVLVGKERFELSTPGLEGRCDPRI